MTPMEAGRSDFLGLCFDRMDAPTASEHVVRLAGLDMFSYVVTPNVDHMVQLHRAGDPALAKSYAEAALCLCDSRILARLARLSGIDLPVVPGSDLTRDLLAGGLADRRIAVVGGDPDLHRALTVRYPLVAWQFHQPPMGVRTSEPARAAIAEFVEGAAADVVFFAIGAPQSEIVCSEILKRGRARGVALCTGASLEFLTGAKERAPLWMRRSSLEWLFRLLSEPRRLWRRYLVDGPRIFSIWYQWQKVNSARLHGSSGSNVSGCE